MPAEFVCIAIHCGTSTVLEDSLCLAKLLGHLDFELILVVIQLVVEFLLKCFNLTTEPFDVLTVFGIAKCQVGSCYPY